MQKFIIPKPRARSSNIWISKSHPFKNPSSLNLMLDKHVFSSSALHFHSIHLFYSLVEPLIPHCTALFTVLIWMEYAKQNGSHIADIHHLEDKINFIYVKNYFKQKTTKFSKNLKSTWEQCLLCSFWGVEQNALRNMLLMVYFLTVARKCSSIMAWFGKKSFTIKELHLLATVRKSIHNFEIIFVRKWSKPNKILKFPKINLYLKMFGQRKVSAQSFHLL